MNITLCVYLDAPSSLYVVGSPANLMSKTWKADMTEKLFWQLSEGFVEFDEGWIDTESGALLRTQVQCRRKEKNTVYLFGKMQSSQRKYIDHMVKNGWTFDEGAAKRYEFPKS